MNNVHLGAGNHRRKETLPSLNQFLLIFKNLKKKLPSHMIDDIRPNPTLFRGPLWQTESDKDMKITDFVDVKNSI